MSQTFTGDVGNLRKIRRFNSSMKISYEDYRNCPNNTLDFEILAQEMLPMVHETEEILTQRLISVHLEQDRVGRFPIKLSVKLAVMNKDGITFESHREIRFNKDTLLLIENVFQIAKMFNGIAPGVKVDI